MKFNKLLVILFFSVTLSISACYDSTGDSNGGATGDSVVSIAAIAGVAAPAIGGTPVTTITETDQYTGTVSWDGGWAWASTFGGDKAYTATITLTAKSGYTLTGVAADFFTVAGATTVSNSADSGTVTATFPATATVSVGNTLSGGKVAYILQSGDSGYVAGEQRGLIVSTTCIENKMWVRWAYSNFVPGGTGTALGTGATNTDKIIAHDEAEGNSDLSIFAAGVASTYSAGGYTDWFLPSKDELDKVFDSGLITYFPDYYWTSSEADASNASSQNMSSGSQSATSKSSSNVVQPVRYF